MGAPVLYMIAGCNGAGKSTLARILLPDFLSIQALVNPDDIAHGLNPLDPVSMDMKAGKLALRQMEEYIDGRKSFAFETTASGRAHLAMLRRAKAQGYQIRLIYLFLTSPKIAVVRVALRVRQGGHDVPEKDIIRRYYRGAQHILEGYLPIVDSASFYISPAQKNIQEAQERGEEIGRYLFAEKRSGGDLTIFQTNIWDLFVQQAQKERKKE